MSKYRLAVIEGDGIGPEIIRSAIAVLDKVAPHCFSYEKLVVGGVCLDLHGVPITDEAMQACKDSDSVLLGAVGGPKWDNLPGHLRAERALLGIRKELELFANMRPAKLFSVLKKASPLRQDIADRGFDMLIMRELTGGIYYGERGRKSDARGNTIAFDTESYNQTEVDRIARVAFEMARKRRKQVCSVDKANVLESSRLWRERVHVVAEEFPDIELSDMLVDNAAMQLVRDPSQFDVLVMANMFGDILSDEASQLTGSIGMLPSASLGEDKRGMYEPIHGSAPDLAGKNLANPLATILSVAMMLKYSFNMPEEAWRIEQAVEKTLLKGHRTKDIHDNDTPVLGTREMTDKVLQEL
ncbi:MAG: 3-isopropylmalate dehydrogenase [Oligosphaeraceae bacterium]|nr:3-isopropylmalate dehydrogenase [Oligosphaeraceae bacterium]